MKEFIAAIDIGTNSVHLVIVKVTSKEHSPMEFQVVESDKQTIRLGQYVNRKNILEPEGEFKLLDAIKRMTLILKPYPEIEVRTVATQAIREAKNSKNIQQKIFEETGIEVEIVDGTEEARLIYLGMQRGLPLAQNNCLAMDIGGGSTEIVITQKGVIRYAASLKLGAVNLTKNYTSAENPSASEISSLKQHIHDVVSPIAHEIKKHSYQMAVASSGSVKAIGQMILFDRGQNVLGDMNGVLLKSSEIMDVTERIYKLRDTQKICKEWQIDKNRSEIMIAGASIMGEITRILDVKEWLISTNGLREGIIQDTISRMHEMTTHNIENDRWYSIETFARKFQIDEDYAKTVLGFSLNIFDQLYPKKLLRHEHQYELGDRELLRCATYLHEVGRFISYTKYHVHSEYLITFGEILGYTQKEKRMMGLIARHHRKAIENLKLFPEEKINKNDTERVLILSSILRLSRSLNRTRVPKLKFKGCEEKGEHTLILFSCLGKDYPHLELELAEKETKHLSKLVGKNLMIEIKS